MRSLIEILQCSTLLQWIWPA